MRRVFLSPSTQEYNLFVSGGSEEFFMNAAMDAAVPYLDSSGILYTRNTPDMTAASSVAMANMGEYDLYISLHSNAAAGDVAGTARGSLVFYYPSSPKGERAANIMAENARKIYPLPDLVQTVTTTTLIEVAKSRAPAILWETAFHDNEEDAEWIVNNLDAIGWAVAATAAEFLGVPLAQPMAPRQAIVSVEWGGLNIRAYPDVGADILATAPAGAQLTVLGELEDGWFVVRYGSLTGYVAQQYVTILE